MGAQRSVVRLNDGEVAEWLKAHAWKACLGETLTWVRIPPSPPPAIGTFGSAGNLALLLLSAVGFSFSGSLENVGKRIVAFVAGVLKDGTGRASKRIFDHPRLRKHRRVLHRCAVEQRVAVDGLEALRHVEMLRCAVGFRLRVEIGRVDDQRIAFPVTDGVAQPLTDCGARMLAPDPYNTDLMKILGQNHHG